ncbi:hypothetical protein M514_05887, partial [Trichuris suis]
EQRYLPFSYPILDCCRRKQLLRSKKPQQRPNSNDDRAVFMVLLYLLATGFPASIESTVWSNFKQPDSYVHEACLENWL